MKVDQPKLSSYTDVSGLEALKARAQGNDAKANRDVAKQFESMFINQMLSAMRAADEVLFEDSYLSSGEVRLYQDMLDKEMSVKLAEHPGIGLADIIEQQMSGQPRMPTASGPLDSLSWPVSAPKAAITPDADVNSGETNRQSLAAPLPRPPITADAVPSAGDADRQAFIDKVYPHARAAAERLGVDPKVLVAQAALETGWGRTLDKAGNNLFGIKATGAWQGERRELATHEVRQGVSQAERAAFRAYGSVADSFDDYTRLISTQPRYERARAVADKPEAFVEALQQAGYATDPKYARKLQSLLRSPLIAGLNDRA